MSTANQTESLRKAIGGKSITVEDKDGGKQQVFVKQLSIRAADAFINVLDDELGQAMIYCDLTTEQLEALDPMKGVNVIIEEGGKLNASFFEYCSVKMQRRIAMQKKMYPDIERREREVMNTVVAAMKEKIEKLIPSAPSAPASAPSQA